MGGGTHTLVGVGSVVTLVRGVGGGVGDMTRGDEGECVICATVVG